jgi:hypothetical protein
MHGHPPSVAPGPGLSVAFNCVSHSRSKLTGCPSWGRPLSSCEAGTKGEMNTSLRDAHGTEREGLSLSHALCNQQLDQT